MPENGNNAPESKAMTPRVDRYFLVIVNDSMEEQPRLISCDDEASFLSAVGEYVLNAQHPMHAFAFRGNRITISALAPTCSVEIDGKRTAVGSDERSFDENGHITPLRKVN